MFSPLSRGRLQNLRIHVVETVTVPDFIQLAARAAIGLAPRLHRHTYYGWHREQQPHGKEGCRGHLLGRAAQLAGNQQADATAHRGLRNCEETALEII